MYYIRINVCTGCGACKNICPTDAIKGTKDKPHRIDYSKCGNCGTCKRACPYEAIDEDGNLS